MPPSSFTSAVIESNNVLYVNFKKKNNNNNNKNNFMINKNQCKVIGPLITKLLVQVKMWLPVSLIRDISTFLDFLTVKVSSS